MNFYFAPMEGVTGYIYRKAHHDCFNNINKYFSPFISTNGTGTLKKGVMDDLAPENNQGLLLVPQILTNNAKDFILMADKIRLMGYNEINLNLGCPSGTVVAKNKGSGFLAKTLELEHFLSDIFSWGSVKISIKTRIGKDNPDEFIELLDIFNQYPIHELTIHPRIQKDYYKNKPNFETFEYALKHSKNSICYNGDISNLKRYREFSTKYTDVSSVMIGRGLVANPGLINEIKNLIKVDKNLLREFHDKIYNGYKSAFFGSVPVLFVMKEIWSYMISMFSENEKYAKKIKKATRLNDYEDAVSSLFREQNLI